MGKPEDPDRYRDRRSNRENTETFAQTQMLYHIAINTHRIAEVLEWQEWPPGTEKDDA